MIILKRASGALKPARQGHLRRGKLTGHEAWVRARLAENGDLTLDELGVELLGRGVSFDRSTICACCIGLGSAVKKASRPPNSSGRRTPERMICGSTGASGSLTGHWRD